MKIREILLDISEHLDKFAAQSDELQAGLIVSEILNATRVCISGFEKTHHCAGLFVDRLKLIGINAVLIDHNRKFTFKKGDFLILVTTSKDSEYIFKLIEKARNFEIKIALFTSKMSPEIKKSVDYAVFVPEELMRNQKFELISKNSIFSISALSVLEAIAVEVHLGLIEKANEESSTE